MVLDRYDGVDHLVVDVNIANRRSWRALERSGYRRIWDGVIESPEDGGLTPSYLYRFG